MPAFRNFNFNELEADEIIGFIVNRHHGYVVRMLDLLKESCEKARIADVDIAPQLAPICSLINAFSEKVLLHIEHEEEILFPYIKKLLQIKRSESYIKFLNINLSETTLRHFTEEHNDLMAFWHQIKQKTNGFKPFEGASPITSLFFAELIDFEVDLSNHFYLEDKVLFPKLSELEKQVNEITELAIGRVPGE
jgi:regulator of cell morphogenesis and NO signaling